MNAQVKAKQKEATISPKKVRPIINLIRGKDVHKAKVILAFNKTKSAALLLKLLKSAEANATHNKGLKSENLYVSDVWVGPGVTRKWGRFAGRGRYSRIFKRTSNVFLGLAEKNQTEVKKD